MIANGLTILCTIIWFVARIINARSDNRRFYWPQSLCEYALMLIMRITRRLILSLGGQQLVSGIALLATAQIKICTISAYHYVTTVMLATMSSSVHMMTLIVLVTYLKQHLWAAFGRFVGIAAHFGQTWVAVSTIVAWSG